MGDVRLRRPRTERQNPVDRMLVSVGGIDFPLQPFARAPVAPPPLDRMDTDDVDDLMAGDQHVDESDHGGEDDDEDDDEEDAGEKHRDEEDDYGEYENEEGDDSEDDADRGSFASFCGYVNVDEMQYSKDLDFLFSTPDFYNEQDRILFEDGNWEETRDLQRKDGLFFA